MCLYVHVYILNSLEVCDCIIYMLMCRRMYTVTTKVAMRSCVIQMHSTQPNAYVFELQFLYRALSKLSE